MGMPRASPLLKKTTYCCSVLLGIRHTTDNRCGVTKIAKSKAYSKVMEIEPPSNIMQCTSGGGSTIILKNNFCTVFWQIYQKM